ADLTPYPSISTFSDRICMDRWISVNKARLRQILSPFLHTCIRLSHYGGDFLYISSVEFPEYPEGAILWLKSTSANGFQHKPFEETVQAKFLFEATLHPSHEDKDTVHLFAGDKPGEPLLVEEITNGAIIMPMANNNAQFGNIEKAIRSIEGYE
ncbi:hypothetical protein KC573_00255, partial [candidate division WWE3 bacterium]|nr:hypothetical protein [candidate division WWE3 bacterium]